MLYWNVYILKSSLKSKFKIGIEKGVRVCDPNAFLFATNHFKGVYCQKVKLPFAIKLL